jgi:hypothetical protein
MGGKPVDMPVPVCAADADLRIQGWRLRPFSPYQAFFGIYVRRALITKSYPGIHASI